jgi:acyl-CoA reductase-like NAD-dependent aldehyde dehydrogenase
MTAGGSVASQTIHNYIGGRWVPAESKDALEVRNPATDEVLALVPLSGDAEVGAAVRAASDAFPAWRATPPQERARYLYKLRALLDEHREEFARLVTTEMGKTLEDARGEVQRGIENVEVACGIPSLMMGYGLEDGAARGIDEEVVYQPLGVCAAITPFNFPFMIPFWFFPYAIATGNTYIVKPSEQDPLTLHRVFELVDQIGLPPGVLNLVNGARDVVNALLDHPDIKAISFVGSRVRVRARIGQWQARSIVRRRQERAGGPAGCQPGHQHREHDGLVLRRGRPALPRGLDHHAHRTGRRTGAGAGGERGASAAAGRRAGPADHARPGRVRAGARSHHGHDHER